MDYPNLHLVEHPCVEAKLARLRDRRTSTCEIRRLVGELGFIIGYEASRDLRLREARVETPVVETSVRVLDDSIVLLPMIRGGLGMVEEMLHLFRHAEVRHIGLQRDEVTKSWVSYYCKLPANMADRYVLLLDPCLETGERASLALDFCKNHGADRLKCISIIVAPEALKVLHETHPDVEIYAAALDDHVNGEGMIVPGMGNAGDRVIGVRS